MYVFASTETWNYNAKGELTQADHSISNAFDRSFEFDGIGNRLKSADSLTLPATDNYTANALNQLKFVGTQERVHDFDGNLTDNGEHLYVWDAENRLVEVKKKSDNSTVAIYAYDFKSRRISKTIGSTVTNFVYDGWNPIAEFSGTTLGKSYVWGMDLSRSMQGVGGVGGLLAVSEGSVTYYPVYDGNGNISEYVDATGLVVAHYEYDAFGQVTPSPTNTKSFTHQFSTKQLDTETGLNYYGYRYYSSAIGRFINRDRIEESGGGNLYGFVGNKPISFIDVMGDIARGGDGGGRDFRPIPIEKDEAPIGHLWKCVCSKKKINCSCCEQDPFDDEVTITNSCGNVAAKGDGTDVSKKKARGVAKASALLDAGANCNKLECPLDVEGICFPSAKAVKDKDCKCELIVDKNGNRQGSCPKN